MRPEDRLAMSKQLQNAFQPFQGSEGFTDEFETIYITGSK